MIGLFKDFSCLIDNTNEVAKKCNVSLKTKGYFLPENPVPKEQNFDSYLNELADESLEKYIKGFAKDSQEDYKTRLKYELDQIKNMGFSSYFLIVYDFIQWAKDNEIPVGPGRGLSLIHI